MKKMMIYFWTIIKPNHGRLVRKKFFSKNFIDIFLIVIYFEN